MLYCCNQFIGILFVKCIPKVYNIYVCFKRVFKLGVTASAIGMVFIQYERCSDVKILLLLLICIIYSNWFYTNPKTLYRNTSGS